MIDVDQQLQALSDDLDQEVGRQAPPSFSDPGRPTRGVVAAAVAVVVLVIGVAVLATNRGPGDLDVATTPDPTAVDAPTTGPATTTPVFVDPPVVDDRPLRLGVAVPGMEAKGAVERCVASDVQSVCGTSVGEVPKEGNWAQTFRLDPDDLTSPSVRIRRFVSLAAEPVVVTDDLGSTVWPDASSPTTAYVTDIVPDPGPTGPPVTVPGGEGHLAETSTEQTTTVGWTDGDGAEIWVTVDGTPSEDALALIAGLRPRDTYGFDLPDGSELVPVLDAIDRQLQVPSEIGYEGGGWAITMSVFPGDRTDYELLVPPASQVPPPPPGSPSTSEVRMGTVRGRQAWVYASHSRSVDETGEHLMTLYQVIWFEPTRGAVVQAYITSNTADPDEQGLALLDQVVELDEATFQALVAATPPPHP